MAEQYSFILICTTTEMEIPVISEEIQLVISLRETRGRVEREMIVAAIGRQDVNIVKTDKALELSRPTLYDLIKKHSLTPLTSTEKATDQVS